MLNSIVAILGAPSRMQSSSIGAVNEFSTNHSLALWSFFVLSFSSLLAQLIVICGKKQATTNQTQTNAPVQNVPNAADLKPQVIPKNAKEEMIAKGELKKGKHDYPTMDDVVSDWDSDKEGADPKKSGKKKKAKEDKAKEAKEEKAKEEKTKEEKGKEEKGKEEKKDASAKKEET